MPKYEIWSEGWRANGGSGMATLQGTASGSSFKEACLDLAEQDDTFGLEYDSVSNTHWGCELFDNEKDARASFG